MEKTAPVATLSVATLVPDDASASAQRHFVQAQRAWRQKRWDSAQIEYERALTLAETFRSHLADEAARTVHLAAFQQINEFYVDLLMQQHQRQPEQGWAARAWEANERAHWHRWQQTLQGISGTAQKPVPTIAFKEILASVQGRLRRDQAVLLEYALGTQRSYAWLLNGTELTAYVLPGRAVIEKQEQLVYQQLSQPAQSADCQALAKLSEMLLQPVKQALPEHARRWLIVADGGLQQVPFTLLTQHARCQTENLVIAQHEVMNLPAALVLLEGMAEHQDLSAGIAVVADPVFGKHDERIELPGEMNGGALAFAALSPAVWQATRFQSSAKPGTVTPASASWMPRLPFARDEAENVARWFAPPTILRALGFDANRQLALAGRLAHYPIIHFATHGYRDSARPAQSGLVLSQVNERGEAQEGLLPLRDICRLAWSAELVVLSACETSAVKTSLRPTPTVSLAEGFLFAGAHRVLGSLWPVNDAATAELMKRFYAGLFGAERLTPAAALRQAQLSLAHDTQWHHPYYWAAFVLQGEY